MADGRYRALERGQGMDYAPSLDAPARAALLAGAVDGTEMVEILGDSRDHVDSVAAAYAAWCVATGRAKPLRDDGEQYSTRTGDDWSQASEGWSDFPAELWQEAEPHWRYRHAAPNTSAD